MVSVELYLILCLLMIFMGFITFKYYLSNIKFIYGIAIIYIAALCLSFLFSNVNDELIFIYIGIFSIFTILLLGIKSPIFAEKVKEN